MAFGRSCHQLRNLGKMVHVGFLRFTFAPLFGMPLCREIPCPGNQQDVAHLSAPLPDCVSISSAVISRSGPSHATTSPSSRQDIDGADGEPLGIAWLSRLSLLGPPCMLLPYRRRQLEN